MKDTFKFVFVILIHLKTTITSCIFKGTIYNNIGLYLPYHLFFDVLNSIKKNCFSRLSAGHCPHIPQCENP